MASVFASPIKPGKCPTYEKNMCPKQINHTNLGGLWYEYVYTPGFLGQKTHDCASWNVLYSKSNDTSKDYETFDVLHHSIN